MRMRSRMGSGIRTRMRPGVRIRIWIRIRSRVGRVRSRRNVSRRGREIPRNHDGGHIGGIVSGIADPYSDSDASRINAKPEICGFSLSRRKSEQDDS
jgi:hypothetical protein